MIIILIRTSMLDRGVIEIIIMIIITGMDNEDGDRRRRLCKYQFQVKNDDYFVFTMLSVIM